MTTIAATPTLPLFAELLADAINLFGIEHQIIRREQLSDRSLVDLHLGRANADGAVADLAVALLGSVGYLDASQPHRRNRAQVDGHLQRLAVSESRGRCQFNPRGTGGDDDLRQCKWLGSGLCCGYLDRR